MRTRILLIAAGVLVVVLLSVWAAMHFAAPRTSTAVAPSIPESRDDIRKWLRPAVGQSVREAIAHLGLEEANRFWTDEPPGILRGASYHLSDNRSVTLFIAEGEPLYRKFSDQRKWDNDAFLDCKVGGVQYHDTRGVYDLGPAVPFQWAGEKFDSPNER